MKGAMVRNYVWRENCLEFIDRCIQQLNIWGQYMADRRTRSEHFLWEQQRLRERSDRKHADKINSDREFFYNTRKPSRVQQPMSYEDASARVDFALSLGPAIWFLMKWLFALWTWYMFFAVFGGSSFDNPIGIAITVIFLGLTLLKQVRRRRKRRHGY